VFRVFCGTPPKVLTAENAENAESLPTWPRLAHVQQPHRSVLSVPSAVPQNKSSQPWFSPAVLTTRLHDSFASLKLSSKATSNSVMLR